MHDRSGKLKVTNRSVRELIEIYDGFLMIVIYTQSIFWLVQNEIYEERLNTSIILKVDYMLK